MSQPQKKSGPHKPKPKSKANPKPAVPSRSKSKSKSKRSRKPNSSNHPQILDELGHTRKERYFARDLSNAVRINARGDTLSRLSSSQRFFLKASSPRKFNTEEELLYFLKKWIPILDAAFFFGIVQESLKEVKLFTSEDKHGKESLGFHDPNARTLNVKVDCEPHAGETMESLYVGIAAHELLHAFFDFYSCVCKYCTKHEHRSARGTLKSGHGPLWANAMIEIQKALERDFFNGEKVFVNIQGSIELEMKQGNWRPRPDQLARWGMDPRQGLQTMQVGQESDEWEELSDEEEEEENRHQRPPHHGERDSKRQPAASCCTIL